MIGCQQCSNATTCEKCEVSRGFYLDSDTQKCKKCQSGCVECNSGDTCLKCRPTLNLTSTNNSQCPCSKQQQQTLNYSLSLSDSEEKPKIYLLTRNLKYEPALYLTRFTQLKCSKFLKLTYLSKPILADQDSTATPELIAQCELQYLVNSKESLLTITGISAEVLADIQRGKAVLRVRKEAASIDCEGAPREEDIGPLAWEHGDAPEGFCLKRLKGEVCMQCAGGQYLDIQKYQCVDECPSGTFAPIQGTRYNFMADQYSSQVNYCRLYDPYTLEIDYYVDTNTDKSFEAGTPQFPFSNIGHALMEIYNFRAQFNAGGNIFKVFVQEGEHRIYSGMLPLIFRNANVTILPWTVNKRPILKFEKVFDSSLENYYFSLYGKSLAQLNYDLKKDNIYPTQLLSASHILLTSSHLILQDLYLKQGKSEDALIQVLESSSIQIERCELEVRQLVLNNRPANITIKDSYLSLGDTRYMINSRDSMLNSESTFILRGNFFRGATQSFAKSSLPLIYIEGYRSVDISNNTFRYRGGEGGTQQPTVMIVHAKQSKQNVSETVIAQNVVERANGWCIALISEQVLQSLTWNIEISGNQFKHSQFTTMPLMKFRMTPQTTSGTLTLSNNQYTNLTLLDQNWIAPNASQPLISLRSMNRFTVTQSGEQFEGLKAHRIISAREISMYNVENSTFKEIRTPDICNNSYTSLQNSDEITSFINVANVTKAYFYQNQYSQIVLGRNKVLHRFTDSQDLTLSNSQYTSIEYFDESRIGVFQNYARFEFSMNQIDKIELLDDRGRFMLWALLTDEKDMGISTVILDNKVSQNDPQQTFLGFLKLENHLLSTSLSPLILEYRRNQLSYISSTVALNAVKILGEHVQEHTDLADICDPREFIDPLLSTVCKRCPLSNCEACGSQDYCIRCVPGYRFDASVKQCLKETEPRSNKWCPWLFSDITLQCRQGQVFRRASRRCEECGLECQVCDEAKKCKQCSFGYAPDSLTGQCLESARDLQSYAQQAEKKCGLGCVKCNQQKQCLECGYGTSPFALSTLPFYRCDCDMKSSVTFDKDSNKSYSAMLQLENLSLQSEWTSKKSLELLMFRDFLKTGVPELDQLVADLRLSSYAPNSTDRSQNLSDTSLLQWTTSQLTLAFQNLPEAFYLAFKAQIQPSLVLDLSKFDTVHCIIPTVHYTIPAKVQFSLDGQVLSTDMLMNQKFKEAITVDQFPFTLTLTDKKKGYGFSTFFGFKITADANKIQTQKVVYNASNSTNVTNTTVELVFCDMFVYDPIYRMDVRLNSKHQHFTFEFMENRTGPMIIDVKTNLPWYNTSEPVLFKAKCKVVESEAEEASQTDENRNVPYEFSLETFVDVDINKKFFTLYSTAPEGMKLPLIYEIFYQISAFREKLTTDQVKKSYEDMTFCLINLKPESLDQKRLISLLLKDISDAIQSDPKLRDGTQTSKNIKAAIDSKIQPNATARQSSGTLDVKNTEPTDYKAIDVDTFKDITSTIDNIITTQRSDDQSQQPTSSGEDYQQMVQLVETFSKSLSAVSSNRQKDSEPVRVSGNSISGTAQMVSGDKIREQGTKIEVSQSTQKPQGENGKKEGSEVKVQIPPKIEQLSQYNQVVVKAVSVDPKVVESLNASKTEDNRQMASNIVMVNIDAAVPSKDTTGLTSLQTVNVENLKTPVTLEIPITSARPHDDYQCSYFNETTKTWEPLPGKFDQKKSAMLCNSTHLSSFTVFALRSDERPYLISLQCLLDAAFFTSLLTVLLLDRQKQPSQTELSQRNQYLPTQQQSLKSSKPQLQQRMTNGQDDTLDQTITAQHNQQQQDLDSDEEPILGNNQERQTASPRIGGTRQPTIQFKSKIASRDWDVGCWDMMKSKHKVIRQFRSEENISRWIKVLGVNSLYQAIFTAIAIMISSDYLVEQLDLSGILLVGFVIMRIVSFTNQRIVFNSTMNTTLKYAFLAFMILDIVVAQIVPILLAWKDPTIALDISVVTGILIFFDIFIWDACIVPLWKLALASCAHLD